MTAPVNVQSKKQMAKLLAKEDITVVHAGTRTATFDPQRRILTLPIWKEMSGDIYDVLVIHEISHALNTPAGNEFAIACSKVDPKYPKSAKRFVNIVEDTRIERLIKILYPGCRVVFHRGYQELVARNFFGTINNDVNEYGIIDRINVHFKVGPLAGVIFSDREMEFIKAIENLMTWDQVVDMSIQLYAYAKEERKKKQSEEQENQQEDQQDDESETSTDDGDDDVVDPDSDSGEDLPDEESDDTEEGETGSEKVKGKSSNSGYNEDGDEPVESETDSAWEDSQKGLIDENAKEFLYLGIPKPKLDSIIVPYKTVHQEIRTFYKEYEHKKNNQTILQHSSEFERFRNENKAVVEWLLKEFELHKAADQYLRRKQSNTGVVDLNKLHKYKYTEDIMRSVTKVSGGKNHALLLFLDFSASMDQHLAGAIHQILNVTMFCRKSNIPFDVYTFGAKRKHKNQVRYGRTHANMDCFDHKQGDYGFYDGFVLRQMLSSKMSAKEYSDACVNLMMLGSGSVMGHNGFELNMLSLPPNDQMGGTPLNETIVTAMELVSKIKKETGAQVVNTVFMTDGEATTNDMYVSNPYGDLYNIDWDANVILRDEITKIDYPLDNSEINTTKQFLMALQERTGTNAIGFFITGEEGNQQEAMKNFCPSRWKKGKKEQDLMLTELASNYFILLPDAGYKEFYLLPGGEALRIRAVANNPLLGLRGLNTNSQIVTAMTEHGIKQKKQRVMLTRFIKLIS